MKRRHLSSVHHPSRSGTFRLLFVTWPLWILTLAITFAAMACNLSAPPPPTIPPLLGTPTPEATIGISTQVPLPLPGNVQAEAPAAPDIENLLRQVQPDRLMTHVQALQNFETRHVNSAVSSNETRGVYAARDYVKRALESYAAQAGGRMTVQQHSFTLEWGELQTVQYNLFATLNGTLPNGGVVIVSAHYDSTTTAYEDGEVYSPGADDNGSGVAALLEIARIMSQVQHRATIMFIAFSAEETGRQGSARFIDEYLSYYNIDVRGVITMDILGNITGPNGEINDRQVRVFSAEPNNSPSRQLARTLNLVANTYVPDLQAQLMPTGDREGRWGDHLSFSLQGYPAIRVMEAQENPNRNHNAQDTVDQINTAYLSRATSVILAGLAVLADGLPPTQNIALRDNPADPANPTLVWQGIEGATGYVLALRNPEGLTFSQVITVGAAPTQLTWNGFTRFEAVAIATIDELGRWGPFSREFRLGAAAS